MADQVTALEAPDAIKETRLDDILFRMEEPSKTHALLAFVEENDGSDVLLKGAYGPMDVTIKENGRTRTVKVGPTGRRRPRKLAIRLLQLYGEDGRYRWMDPRTGVTASRYQTAQPAQREYWDSIGVKLPNGNYLTHIPDDLEDED